MKFIPKKYMAMIEEVYKDSEGYWAYAKKGFKFAGMGCHTAHEYTQKDLLAMIRTLEPCTCGECTAEEAEEAEEAAEIVEEAAEIVEVANFVKDNCHYIIKQPKKETPPDEFNEFYKVLGEIRFGKRKKAATTRRNYQ